VGVSGAAEYTPPPARPQPGAVARRLKPRQRRAKPACAGWGCARGARLAT